MKRPMGRCTTKDKPGKDRDCIFTRFSRADNEARGVPEIVITKHFDSDVRDPCISYFYGWANDHEVSRSFHWDYLSSRKPTEISR